MKLFVRPCPCNWGTGPWPCTQPSSQPSRPYLTPPCKEENRPPSSQPGASLPRYQSESSQTASLPGSRPANRLWGREGWWLVVGWRGCLLGGVHGYGIVPAAMAVVVESVAQTQCGESIPKATTQVNASLHVNCASGETNLNI